MAITQVGATVAGTAGNGANVTLTLPAMLEGDMVLLIGGHAGKLDGSLGGPVEAGYTEIIWGSSDSGDGTGWGWMGAWYKIMGPTPDTTVTGEGRVITSTSTAYHAIVLRGVDTAAPVEAVSVFSAPGGSGPPDPPAAGVTTLGAWVFACAFLQVLDAVATAPTGYSGLSWASANDTNDCANGFAYKEATATGTEDPGAFGGLIAGTNPGAFTFVIKPAGAAAEPPGQGSGTGTLTFTGTGSGSRDAAASGSGTLGFTGTGSGSRASAGSGTGTLAFSGAGQGSRAAAGAGAGELAFTGEGTGARTAQGSGTGELLFTGTGEGSAPAPDAARGFGAGTLAWAGTGAGSRSAAGAGAGLLAYAGSGSGSARHSGSGSGLLTWSGVGTGRVPAEVRDVVVLGLAELAQRTVLVSEQPRTVTVTEQALRAVTIEEQP